MHIDSFSEVIMNCRFCFMCRHLSAVANVTCRESDTPRVRAAMLYSATLDASKLTEPDLADALYRADLAGSCRRNCVSHYDEVGLVLAARRDLADAGLVPEKVKQLADQLEKGARWTVSGSGDTAFFEDPATAAAPASAKAFARLAAKAKIEYRTIRGGCIGKSLYVLGFEKRAKAAAKKFAAFLNKTGVKTLVVANPAAYDALTRDYPAFGIKLHAKVVHTAEFIAGLKIAFKKGPAAYAPASDFLRNYDADPGPDALLRKLKTKVLPFGTNDEESYSSGEAALVLHLLEPELASALARRVAECEPGAGKTPFVTASPYTRTMLAAHTDLNVMTFEEYAAACL